MDIEQTNLSLEQMLGILVRRAPWIVLCLVLVAGAAYAFSKDQPKKYTATASLVFSENQLGQQIAGLSVASSSSPQVQQSTNLKLVELGDMAAKTAARLGHGLTKEEISADLSVSAEGESNLVSVSATASSPKLAADIANIYTTQFVTGRQNSNHAYYASALRLVNKQLAALSRKERTGPAGLALQTRAQSLGILAELRNGNVQIAQPAAVPTSPSSPKVSRNTILGAVLGLLLGLGVALLLERFDRRIREPKEMEAIYGLPLLGVVPESKALARAARGKGNSNEPLPPDEAEAFNLLRAHLRYFNVEDELRTILVVSATPGEGKTAVARHLAGTAARMGAGVLLVEADLRHPTLARQLDVDSRLGVSDVLVGTVSLSEAAQVINLGAPSVGDAGSQMRFGGKIFDVAVAGAPLPPNPGELIESYAMEGLLEQARSTYDLVVIDTSPLAVVSDAFPLLRKVDGVIVVGRIGRHRRDVAERLRETLLGASAPLLGIVANGLKPGRFGPPGGSYTTRAEPAPATKASARGASPSEEPLPTAEAQEPGRL